MLYSYDTDVATRYYKILEYVKYVVIVVTPTEHQLTTIVFKIMM
jgi:hypothetical protein